MPAIGRASALVRASLGVAPALLSLALAIAAIPEPGVAETYDECFRRDCEANPGYVMCGNLCGLRSYSPTPAAPRAPLLYGAIAVDDRTLITGAAKDYPSRADAERRALAMCRRAGGAQGGCRIAVSRNNSCLALATSQGASPAKNTWGYAYSDDGWVSRRNATAECRRDGSSSCKVAVSFCTG